MDTELEVELLAFGELPDEDWEAQIASVRNTLLERAASSGSDFEIRVTEKNIGRGADWIVLAVHISVALIAIPAVHKKIRENIEEWLRICRELRAFFRWIFGEKKALYPDEFLFLIAIEALDGAKARAVTYNGAFRLPENNPDLIGRESLVFSFSDSEQLYQIAVSRSGHVLWRNAIPL